MKVILVAILLLFTRQLLASEVLSDMNMVIDCKDRKKIIVGSLKLNSEKFGDGIFSLSDGSKLPIFRKKVTETNGGRLIRYRTLHKGIDILLVNLDMIPKLFIVNFELDGKTVMSDEYFCIRKMSKPDTANIDKMLSPETHAKLVANELAESSPQRLNKFTILEGAVALGKNVTIMKKISPANSADQKTYHKILEDINMSDETRNIMKNTDVKNLCSSEDINSFFKKGGSYTYNWKNIEGMNLFNYSITDDDCNE